MNQTTLNLRSANSDTHNDNLATPEQTISVWFLFKTFFAIGCISFGGFMALISVIETRIVKQRQLLNHTEMLDAISLANLLPGPQAVNVVAYVGYRLRGPIGALTSAVAVLVPAFALILLLSYFYFKYGEIVSIKKIFQGFIPAVTAIVMMVVLRLASKTVKGWREIALILLACSIMLVAPLQYKIYATVGIVLTFGILGYFLFKQAAPERQQQNDKSSISVAKLFGVVIFLVALVVLWFMPLPLEKNSLILMTLTFASMSLMLFGGGYVFIPVIGSVVVLQYGWVTQQEFTDGIAMGQITPGPILISAAFIGFKTHGWLGALLATIAIYTPPAVLMVTASQALSYIQRSTVMQAAMHGIHCGVIGLIAVASLILLKASYPAWPFSLNDFWSPTFILLASLYALIRLKLDILWVILAAGLLGYLLY